MTTASIPDIDLEKPLHVVRIDLGKGEQEYLIGHTGNVYHKDRYIVGVFMDWSGSIKKNERVDLKFVPILGQMKQKTTPLPTTTKPTTPPPKTKSPKKTKPTPSPKTKSPKKTKPIPPPKRRINLVF